MGTLRSIKKSTNSKFLEQLAYERGYHAGSKEQRKMDVKFLANILANIEDCPGVGEKTAEKIQRYFMNKFGK